MSEFITVHDFVTKMRAYLDDFEQIASENYAGETHTFFSWLDVEYDIYLNGVDE